MQARKETPMFQFHPSTFTKFMTLVLPVFWAGSALATGFADDAPSVRVPYYDLNLDSREGVVSLYARIHAAAASVCKTSDGHPAVDGLFATQWDICVNHSVARAVRIVNNDKLSAYHWSQIRGWKNHWAQQATTEAER
jgi:UrcA family protein